jgi:hypothetical protein
LGKNAILPADGGKEDITREDYESLKAELDIEKAKTADADIKTASLVSEATRPLQERIASMELEIKARDEAFARNKAALEEKSNGFASLAVERDASVKAYADLVKKFNPLVPGEMIAGNNVAEIEASLEKAAGIVERVRKSLELQSQGDRVPPGSPGRTEPDTGSMSSKEKITYGLGRTRSSRK